jgi:phage terminase small subunit
MAPRGRKPKPTHLKVVTGNPGKRQINENEPQPDLSIPAPPPHLSDEAKVEWGRVCDQLYRLKLLSDIDRASLAAYAQAYGRWVQAERALAKDGRERRRHERIAGEDQERQRDPEPTGRHRQQGDGRHDALCGRVRHDAERALAALH